MEEMTKPQTLGPSSTPSKLGIGKDSHMISKFKPKIRIIHVFAPEIIKTDAASFRELVQRLTGKPEDEDGGDGSKKKIPPEDLLNLHSKQPIAMEEEEEEFLSQQNGIRVKNEEKEEDRKDEMRRRSKSNEKFSGFFDGFSELDGFMEDLSVLPGV